ncbi:hypothetical protein BD413DRAFT_512684 [Trametes elegans]|nr:hypothetical protein BD413DRAFT_512684 [Trametes elegans]
MARGFAIQLHVPPGSGSLCEISRRRSNTAIALIVSLWPIDRQLRQTETQVRTTGNHAAPPPLCLDRQRHPRSYAQPIPMRCYSRQRDDELSTAPIPRSSCIQISRLVCAPLALAMARRATAHTLRSSQSVPEQLAPLQLGQLLPPVDRRRPAVLLTDTVLKSITLGLLPIDLPIRVCTQRFHWRTVHTRGSAWYAGRGSQLQAPVHTGCRWDSASGRRTLCVRSPTGAAPV